MTDHSHWTLDPTALESVATHVQGLAERQGVAAGVAPTAAELQMLIEESFWATIIPDEGRYPTFSILFSPREACTSAFPFEPVPLSAQAIARLAPAVKSQVSRLGVTRSGDGRLQIWGVVADRTTNLEIRGIGPGRVVIQLGWENLGAVTAQDARNLVESDPAIKVENRRGLGRPQAAAMFAAQFESARMSVGRRTLMGLILLMVAESMRAQGNGGTIIIVPSEGSPVLRAINLGNYRITGSQGKLLFELLEHFTAKLGDRDAMQVIPQDMEFKAFDLYLQGRLTWVRADIRAAIDAVGQLTAIDGAVVLTEDLRMLSFGATIIQPPGTLERIQRRTFPDLRPGPPVDISRLGGTRKQSAARLLVNNGPDPVVLVASHDGPLFSGAWGLGEAGGAVPLWVSGLETALD
jgi:hypothetical protein